MDQQLVGWMLSGGASAEPREQRLQRFYRSELRFAASVIPSTTTPRGWLASVAASLGRRDAAPMAPIAQCCAA